jgi:GNAT superfamily N-acetyltransferase
MENRFTLLVHPTCALDEPIRADIIRLCEEAHKADFSLLFHYLPADGLHVLGMQGNKVVSHAVRTTRWAQPEGQPPLKTAYIDAVSTCAALQGKGIGSAVMRRIVAECASDPQEPLLLLDPENGPYRMCALETDKPRFYTRLGWEIWSGPLAGRGPNGLIPTPEAHGHVLILRLPHTPRLDRCGLLTIEEQGRIW